MQNRADRPETAFLTEKGAAKTVIVPVSPF